MLNLTDTTYESKALTDGLRRLPRSMPDFAKVRNTGEYMNGGLPLSGVKAARLAGYLADAGLMARLRVAAASDVELYNFAVDNYEAQWTKQIDTC